MQNIFLKMSSSIIILSITLTMIGMGLLIFAVDFCSIHFCEPVLSKMSLLNIMCVCIVYYKCICYFVVQFVTEKLQIIRRPIFSSHFNVQYMLNQTRFANLESL